jgi:hypothetical protein
MSTKTNFKRIALVAVAALGLGVLSSVPAKAVGNLAVTVTNGTFVAGLADSTNAATIAVSATLEDIKDINSEGCYSVFFKLIDSDIITPTEEV